MKDINLLVSFTKPGDGRVHVKGAARLKVDGQGLTLYEPHTGESEQIVVDCLRSLSIQSLEDKKSDEAID